MSREANMPTSEKMHDRASVRRELAKTLRKYLPESAPAAEVVHDRASVKAHVLALLKKSVENHAEQMAALRARELRKSENTGTGFALTDVTACMLCGNAHNGGCATFAKAAEVVDMKGNRKTLGAVTPKPAEPTKPVGMDEGSGGVIVPGKKMKKAEPPTAKPPSGSIPGKTVPQSQPGGAPAAGAPKSSAMPTQKKECEHGPDCDKCEMKKALGDYDRKSQGTLRNTTPKLPGSLVRGTPHLQVKVPGRTGTAHLMNPRTAAAPAAAPGAAPLTPSSFPKAPAGVKVPRPAAPTAVAPMTGTK